MTLKEDPRVLNYLGFMNGDISRLLFFLFCAGVVFPIQKMAYVLPKGEVDNSWVNWMAGVFLVACAITQLVKLCMNRNKEEDVDNRSEPMMENAANPYP